MYNHLCIDNDFGWFVGNLHNNQTHKHYAIQLCLPLHDQIVLNTNKGIIKTDRSILIASNIPHQIISNTQHFVLLINPASTIGHFWKSISKDSIQELDYQPVISELKSNLLSPTFSIKKLNNIIKKYDCFCNSAIHAGDERINTSLIFLSKNYDRIVSLEEMADYCALSPSRFLHLFKQQTGVTFRRAQLWFKVRHAVSLFDKKSITEIAHEVGFSDSGHLSRTFKENFGFSPREFIKFSQFIQV